MRRMRCAAGPLCAALVASATPLLAQSQDTRTPQQHADSLAIAALARNLTAALSSDSAKAAALYEWVGTNIAYDVPRYLAGDIADQPAERVFRDRVGVCSGYVSLYRRMAEEIGLQVEVIYGYAKGFDYVFGQPTNRANHAWLAVRLGGAWQLLDPTWASGAVIDGGFVPRFTWDYFLVDPEALVLSHFPRKTQWQLVQRPLQRREFERMPAVPRSILGIGFTPAEIRAAAKRGTLRDFPLVGQAAPGMRVLQAPLTGSVAAADPVAIDIVWPGAVDIAFVVGDRYTALAQDGDRFRGAATADGTPLFVVGRTDRASEYRTLLLYQVR